MVSLRHFPSPEERRCSIFSICLRQLGFDERQRASSEHLRARGDTAKFLNPSTLLRRLANDRHCVSGRNAMLACLFRVARDTTRHVSPARLPHLVSTRTWQRRGNVASCLFSHSERLRFGVTEEDDGTVYEPHESLVKNSNRFYWFQFEPGLDVCPRSGKRYKNPIERK